MIRKFTDEELEKVINPFYDNYHEYIITYVMPEVIAFYLIIYYFFFFLFHKPSSHNVLIIILFHLYHTVCGIIALQLYG